MITLHFHLQPQYKYELFHINFTINWSVPNIWVFIAHLVDKCSANAEAMVSNPVEALKFIFRLKFAVA